MQCATVGSFGAHWQETLYNMFTFACLFLLPLLVMVLCYGRILAAISGRMKEAGGERGGSAAAFFFSFYSLSFPFSPRYHPFLSPPTVPRSPFHPRTLQRPQTLRPFGSSTLPHLPSSLTTN